MKKALLFVIVFSIFAISISTAQSFGIKMGMTYDDLVSMGCKPRPEGHLNKYYVSPPNPHALFVSYAVDISPIYGVDMIAAVSQDISTPSDGSELKGAFNVIKRQISKTYGKSLDYDFVREGSSYKEESYWMSALYDNDRTLASYWDRDAGSNMPDDLDSIVLIAGAKYSLGSGRVGYLVLRYTAQSVAEFQF
jgi:hypothetical protein